MEKRTIYIIAGIAIAPSFFIIFTLWIYSAIDCYHQSPAMWSWAWSNYNYKCYGNVAGPSEYESCQTCVTGKTEVNSVLGKWNASSTVTMGWCGASATEGRCLAGTSSGPTYNECGEKWTRTIDSCNSLP